MKTADGNIVTAVVDRPADGPARIVLKAGAIPVVLSARHAKALARRLLSLAASLE